LQKLSPQGAVSGSAITWKQIQQLNSAVEKATKKAIKYYCTTRSAYAKKKRIEVEEDNHSGVFQGR
jgi:ABC-type transporter lipoprotein component MlaA